MSLFAIEVDVTTNGDGAATAYTPAFTGYIRTISVAKGTLAATTDIAITNEDTSEAILTLTDVAANSADHPRVLQQDVTGNNVAGEYTDVFVVAGRVKIVVAQGGAAASGTIRFDIEGDALTQAANPFVTRTLTDPAVHTYVDVSKPPYLSDGSL